MAIRILDIGQCGFDGPRMAALWREKLGATVDRCGAAADALQCLSRANYDVIMVNRILSRTGESGLDVIRDLIEGGAKIPVMLVSDHEDAQEEAVAVGAVRGIGKAELGEQSTLDLVARVAKGKS